MKKYLITLIVLISISYSFAQKTITFSSKDNVLITADEYIIDKKFPTIILCHQAMFSRGEYIEIAPKLNNLGFNCIAIDQRSGQGVNGIKNETNNAAKAQRMSTSYLDAEQDISSAIDYYCQKMGKKLIIWGSSYSASLVLKVATENEKVDAVLSFSPGEYFGKKMILKTKIKSLQKPMFVTSSKKESKDVATLISEINSDKKTQFIPSGKGNHGSKALWESKANHKEYWIAVKKFLNTL